MNKNRVLIIKSGNTLNVNVNSKQFTINFKNKEEILKAIETISLFKKDNKIKELLKFLDKSYVIIEDGIFHKTRENTYYLKGYKVKMPLALVERIKEHIEADLPIEPLINFWKLLMANPNKHIRQVYLNLLNILNFLLQIKVILWLINRLHGKENLIKKLL